LALRPGRFEPPSAAGRQLNAQSGGQTQRWAGLLRITTFQIKLVHTLIFWVLSLCVAYALFSGVADRITVWTWVTVLTSFCQGGSRIASSRSAVRFTESLS
jgi:hypothetical protein